MLELDQVVTLFYPSKSPEERGLIQARCKKTAIDYDVKAWAEVSSSDLQTDRVKDNLLATFYYNQDSYYGVIDEILASLETWSNGILLFPDLDDQSNDFYQRFYGITGFTFFPFILPTSQIFLLGSRFILLAFTWGLPVIPKFIQYFARFCSLDVLKRDARWFAEAIKKNPTLVQTDLTLGAWVTKSISDNVITETENMSLEVGKEIIKLYRLLKSDKIWTDLEFSTCSHAKTDVPEKINVEEFYLHRLGQTNDLSAWINDYQIIAEWCKGRSLKFVKGLLAEVQKKLPLEQYEELIVNLVTELENNGFTELNGVIFFNESTSQFEWNPDLLS